MRISKRRQARHTGLDDGLAEYLFRCCDRLGCLVHLSPDDWFRLADDPVGRDKLIRDTWAEHSAELLSRWAVEHPGDRPCVLDYLETPPQERRP